jgi:hypothetical protein
MGHKRTNRPGPKSTVCLLLSESGQTPARPVCPLSANRDRCTATNSISIFDHLVGAGEQHGQHSANRKTALWRLFGFLDFISRSGCKSLA